jgi:hypothetical protein
MFIGWSYTRFLFLALIGNPTWLSGPMVTGYNFESWPPKDHSCHVCFKLTYWFQRRRLLNIFSIGSYVKTKSSHGGHPWLPGPMMCSDWLTLWKSSCQKPPSQLNCDFAGMIIGWSCTKPVNRKLTDGRTDAYPWQKLTWPMARWAKNIIP